MGIDHGGYGGSTDDGGGGGRVDCASDPSASSISEVAERTGLSRDTLRWYESEGLIPRIPRSGTGIRRYDADSLRIIDLIVRLRRTGMPVADMRRFVDMVGAGAATHGRRMHLSEEHREVVVDRIRQLTEDLGAVDAKITHYRRLIDDGLDCSGNPISDARQRTDQLRTS